MTDPTTRQWPDNICGGQITYRPASLYEGFALADAEHGIPTFGAVKATGTTIFNYPGQTEDIAKQLCHRWNTHGDMLKALKICQRVLDEALPKFDWAKSPLDANAIFLLNEFGLVVPSAIAKAEAA